MQNISCLTDQEKTVLIEDFIVSTELVSPIFISVELLKYLRRKQIKIENITLFNEICDMIEQKYFK